jgi:hypothetical protein
MLAGLPTSSPNLSTSNPSLSPVGSSEEGRAVSPLPASALLPPRLSLPPTSLGSLSLPPPPGSSSPPSDSSPRVPPHSAAGGLDPSQLFSSAEAAAAAAASNPLSGLSAYSRLPPAMMALSAVPGLGSPYAAAVSGEGNPYASLAVENFYNPLVSYQYVSYKYYTNFKQTQEKNIKIQNL